MRTADLARIDTYPCAVDARPSLAFELLALLQHPGSRALPGIACPRFGDVGKVDLLGGRVHGRIGGVKVDAAIESLVRHA